MRHAIRARKLRQIIRRRTIDQIAVLRLYKEMREIVIDAPPPYMNAGRVCVSALTKFLGLKITVPAPAKAKGVNLRSGTRTTYAAENSCE